MNSTQIKSSWDQHGAHLGPVGPRWSPWWPNEPWYQGCIHGKRIYFCKIDSVFRLLGQHWLRYWSIAWRHWATYGTNVELSSLKICSTLLAQTVFNISTLRCLRLRLYPSSRYNKGLKQMSIDGIDGRWNKWNILPNESETCIKTFWLESRYTFYSFIFHIKCHAAIYAVIA